MGENVALHKGVYYISPSLDFYVAHQLRHSNYEKGEHWSHSTACYSFVCFTIWHHHKESQCPPDHYIKTGQEQQQVIFNCLFTFIRISIHTKTELCIHSGPMSFSLNNGPN